MKEWEFKKNLKRSEREDILQAVCPFEADIVIDLTGRKHKKQKLVRWEKESLSVHPSIVSTQGTRVVEGRYRD